MTSREISLRNDKKKYPLVYILHYLYTINYLSIVNNRNLTLLNFISISDCIDMLSSVELYLT